MTAPRSTEAHPSATPTRIPRALLQPELWRYATRLVPWTLGATGILLATAWAIRTHLDTANERSVLTVISTLPLCAVLDDDAAVLTAAAPSPLWARRLPRAAVPVLLLGAACAVIVAIVAVRRTGPEESGPWWAMTLEWSTVAASQLAVAAVTARRPGTTASIAPGLLVALVWLTAGAAPTLHRHLHEVRSHAVTWCALLTAALATIIAASQEGGGRRRGGALTR